MKLVEEREAKAAENSNDPLPAVRTTVALWHLGPHHRQYGGNLVTMNAAGRPLYGWRVIRPARHFDEMPTLRPCGEGSIQPATFEFRYSPTASDVGGQYPGITVSRRIPRKPGLAQKARIH